MSRIPLTIKIGDVVDAKKINQEFKCAYASGMNFSTTYNALVLFSHHEGGLYSDRWDKDILHYTGMGQHGDMEMNGPNRRLKDAKKMRLKYIYLKCLKKQNIPIVENLF